MRRPALLAVDGGGSKMDAVLLRRDGNVLAAARVRASGYQETGDDAFLDQIEVAVAAACTRAGLDPARRPIADLGVFCLAGADLPQDDRRIGRGLRARGWAARDVLRNDTFAVLRTGSERNWGVGVVCGYGTNCSGVAPDGRMYRFAAVGPISGDFGGGSDLGAWALWHAIRAEDGRGPATTLRRAVPAHFGLRRPTQVMEALYFGRLDGERLAELAPPLFKEAAAGDTVARDLVWRQADEIALMAGVAIRRLRMTSLDPDVVLGGGVIRTNWKPFHERIVTQVHTVAPNAHVVRLTAPPVVGAAMLGLDEIGAGRNAHARARSSLTHEVLTRKNPPRRRRS
jgi:N-acetylglucosamine kinase-like BadF-type ATPase